MDNYLEEFDMLSTTVEVLIDKLHDLVEDGADMEAMIVSDKIKQFQYELS